MSNETYTLGTTRYNNNYYIIIIYLFLILTTFTLNFYIIIVIFLNNKKFKQKKFTNVTCTNRQYTISNNIFILSICLLGVLISLINMPSQVIYYYLDYKWLHNDGSQGPSQLSTCIIWYIIYFSTCSISLLNFIIISYIRYKSITKPKLNVYFVSKKFQLITLICIWIIPIVFWSILISILLKTYTPINDDCYLKIETVYAVIIDLSLFAIPLIILIVINIMIMIELKKQLNKVKSVNIRSLISTIQAVQIATIIVDRRRSSHFSRYSIVGMY